MKRKLKKRKKNQMLGTPTVVIGDVQKGKSNQDGCLHHLNEALQHLREIHAFIFFLPLLFFLPFLEAQLGTTTTKK